MAENSKIEWTDHTANFWWGCLKVSPGCANCYAETWSKRYGKVIWGPPETTEREYKKGVWNNVVKWNKEAKKNNVRKRVFVQSMADFFEDHPQVVEWRTRALQLMVDCLWLDFQVLTKRPENINRMVEQSTGFSDAAMYFHAARNVWIGTSVEDQKTADERIPHLLRVPATVRFLSCEPLLGPINLGLDGITPKYISARYKPVGELIDWAIVGGESGPNARPMNPNWARALRDQCQVAGVAFFFKQWGAWAWSGQWIDYPEFERDELPRQRPRHVFDNGTVMYKVGKKAAGRLLDGQEWNEMPSGGWVEAEDRK